MTMLIAALLLGAAAPPPDDDDRAPVGRPAAAAPKADDDDDAEEGGLQPVTTIVVTARRLDAARTRIDAGLGATVYSLTNDAVENRPGGETGSVADILAQVPGTTLSGKTLNVRGAPVTQVRINNVIVPEAIADPADQLSSRLAQTTRLITGTLPAQFGFAPAGVISITTKNGLYHHGGQAELFAGSDGLLGPALEWSGSIDRTSMFASGSIERDRSTVRDAAGIPFRDRRVGAEGLGFADHVIDEENRVSLILGGAHDRHHYAAAGVGDGVRTTGDAYGVATYQHSDADLTVQASAFAGRWSDAARWADRTRERRSSWGAQVDASAEAGTSHTVKFGLLATRSTASEVEGTGRHSGAARSPLALYAQDEWKLAPTLTFNPGARAEWLRGPGAGVTIEPRASVVLAAPHGLTAHLGFARYASAPPLGRPTGTSRLPNERDDYVDAGAQRAIGPMVLGVDAYWRTAHDFLTARETPGSALSTPFAFRRARMKGVELSATYARGGTTAWANVSLAAAEARTFVGADAIFSPATIAAAAGRSIPLASSRPLTASSGFTRRLGELTLGGDVLISSGTVRSPTDAEPDRARHPAYAVLGVAAVYHARIAHRPADLRIDFTNLTNAHYATGDATNLDGGWTHWGRGRALTLGIEQGF